MQPEVADSPLQSALRLAHLERESRRERDMSRAERDNGDRKSRDAKQAVRNKSSSDITKTAAA